MRGARFERMLPRRIAWPGVAAGLASGAVALLYLVFMRGDASLHHDYWQDIFPIGA